MRTPLIGVIYLLHIIDDELLCDKYDLYDFVTIVVIH